MPDAAAPFPSVMSVTNLHHIQDEATFAFESGIVLTDLAEIYSLKNFFEFELRSHIEVEY
jgi:hypothetical protein